MPVTKTAKRALRSSLRKNKVNKLIISKLEIAIREARKTKSKNAVLKAISLSDIASKKKAIHKNKAARIKSALSKLLPKTSVKKTKSPKPTKKSGKKKAS